MAKYRKLPVVIEAVQFTEETKDQVFNFIACNCYPDFDKDKHPIIRIETLEGDITATIGDWIIKGIAGEFYPCKDKIFKQTYEEVT